MHGVRHWMRKTPFVPRLICLALYMCLVFALSSIAADELPRPGFSFKGLDKIVHVCVYGGFGFLLAWAAETPKPGQLKWRLASVVALAFVLGASDEFYQSTIPGREMSVYDLFADLIGATIGALVFTWMFQEKDQICPS